MKTAAKYRVKKIKLRDCEICKTKFLPSTSFIKWCCPDHGYELAKRKLEKKKKAELKEWNKEYKERKEKDKKLSEYEADARRVFQKWIRKRDEKDPCISCGRFADRYDGGHYFKAELISGLIFHEDNCNKQCSRPCNKDLHGNEANYRIGLIKKIGEERVKWLEENKDRLRNYKYSKEELIEIKKKYNQKLKE